jgi:hypothetical protein
MTSIKLSRNPGTEHTYKHWTENLRDGGTRT